MKFHRGHPMKAKEFLDNLLVQENLGYDWLENEKLGTGRRGITLFDKDRMVLTYFESKDSPINKDTHYVSNILTRKIQNLHNNSADNLGLDYWTEVLRKDIFSRRKGGYADREIVKDFMPED